MLEDGMTRDEAIRAKALEIAVISLQGMMFDGTELAERAAVFIKFIKAGSL